MKKKKGFTLVELMAVIVILAILALIAVPNVLNISRNTKKRLYCEKVTNYLSDAKRWGDNHLKELRSDCYIVKNVSFLVSEGISSDSDIVSPYNKRDMNYDNIGIYLKNKRAYAFYIVDDSFSSDDKNILNDCVVYRVCDDGEDEMTNHCTKRPNVRCS